MTDIDVTHAFQHKELTPIIGKPHYDALKIVETELRDNALTIKSNVNGGNVGWAGLILRDDDYQTLTGHNFVPPPQPPPLRVPGLLTTAQITVLVNAHKEATREYKTYREALKHYAQCLFKHLTRNL